MTSQDDLEQTEYLPPFESLKGSSISPIETPFLARVHRCLASEKERVRAQALRILQAMPSWNGRLAQLIRSAHECGTAASAEGARERFHALNAQRLDDFLVQQAHELDVLLWDGVYAQLFIDAEGPGYLEVLSEGIRALRLLRAVGTLPLRSRPPSWYSYAELPICYPTTLGAAGRAQEQERDTGHPISGVRSLPEDDLSIIKWTLKALKSR
jgi:hypothetical protein